MRTCKPSADLTMGMRTGFVTSVACPQELNWAVLLFMEKELPQPRNTKGDHLLALAPLLKIEPTWEIQHVKKAGFGQVREERERAQRFLESSSPAVRAQSHMDGPVKKIRGYYPRTVDAREIHFAPRLMKPWLNPEGLLAFTLGN